MNENLEESRAKQWLEGQGCTDIRRPSEDPPDFVAGGCIAVEVRRLNWMTDTTKPNQGVEEIEHPLERTIRKILDEAGGPPGGYNVSVWCDLLYDALPKTRVTQKQVGKAVNEYVDFLSEALQSGGNPVKWRTQLECGISIHFYPTPTSKTGKFVLIQVAAATSLRGWVVADSIDNINRCIVEKTGKIQDKIHLYPKWWLVLVDRDLFHATEVGTG